MSDALSIAFLIASVVIVRYTSKFGIYVYWLLMLLFVINVIVNFGWPSIAVLLTAYGVYGRAAEFNEKARGKE